MSTDKVLALVALVARILFIVVREVSGVGVLTRAKSRRLRRADAPAPTEPDAPAD